MLGNDIQCGQRYGFREHRKSRSALQCVQILKHVRGRKWQVKWIDTHPGLVDYVDSEQIMVPWNEHAFLLREEQDREQMRRHNIANGYVSDSPLADAVDQVLASVGERISFVDGCMVCTTDQLQRLRVRADLKEAQFESTLPTYTDRFGRLHLPFEMAVQFARAFCTKEPAGVLAEVEAIDRDWSLTASHPGGEYVLPLWNKYRASWAILRQWCGQDAAIAARERRISELERLVWDAVYVLQKAGLDREAAVLRRKLDAH